MAISSPSGETLRPGAEYPPKADLRRDVYRPLPQVAPGTVDPAAMTRAGGGGDTPATAAAQAVLNALNAALLAGSAEGLAGLFYEEQAFWRDIVALTSHLRSFATRGVVAAALLRTRALRGIEGRGLERAGEAHFAVMSPVMMFIDCGFSFRTSSPALSCAGKLVLLPVKTDEGILSWKIWVLSTWVEDLVQSPEDESLLALPGRKLEDSGVVETDVFIVGAGSSGLGLAARLKALGVESVITDHNARVGENWDRRYDCVRFHVPTSSCEMPYKYFREELQSPHWLSKDDVAEHLREYAEDFHLNVILSAAIRSTLYDPAEKKWTLKLETSGGTKTIIAKHLVQATGFSSAKPYLPAMADQDLYKGISIHSAQYRNAQQLAEQGVKSVAVIGSANTAFDIMEDCHGAGLQTTMVARSPTYVFPHEYVMDPHGIGAYEVMPLDVADRLLMTFPLALDGQFAHGLFAHLASQEPDRYLALAQAGFPVLDSLDPSVDIQHHLVERGGGHYVDVGGTAALASGAVAVRGRVAPVGYTASGVRLSDGSALGADAVVWCTGFADRDVRAVAGEMLGGGGGGGGCGTTDAHPTRGTTTSTNSDGSGEGNGDDVLLGPEDVVARLDASWGVDAEGEVRGMWKRHLRMDNFWVMGGNMQQQRWWSRPLAQQIKLALEGVLPPAYRDTPRP